LDNFSVKKIPEFLAKKALMEKKLNSNNKKEQKGEKNFFTEHFKLSNTNNNFLYNIIKKQLAPTKKRDSKIEEENKNHKKFISYSNSTKQVSNLKKSGNITTKRIDSTPDNIDINMNPGFKSEEFRNIKKKNVHQKKFTDLIKSYDMDEINLKNLSLKYKTSRFHFQFCF
jgi:hypothetical protein